MNENLDLTEILKDCPIGTKFYSSYLGKDVFFIGIHNNYIECEYPPTIDSPFNSMIQFRKEGSLYNGGECMLLPSKDQRDWSKWHRPFVDGDVFVCSNLCGYFIAIYNNLKRSNFYGYYAIVTSDGEFNTDGICSGDAYRLATEEEKQKLFKAIQENGYKWNAETKTLEKLIVPKFKVGDKVRNKANGRMTGTIIALCKEVYEVKNALGNEFSIDFINQDRFELVPNKFDPKTLQPFDKVLGKLIGLDVWHNDFYSHYDKDCKYPYMCTSRGYKEIIPYNDDTKHLIGKTDEAPEYYRYWEE